MIQRRSIVGLITIAILAAGLLGPVAATKPEVVRASYLTRMGYYVNYDPNSWSSLVENIQHLDIVAPYAYHLTPSGAIKEFDQPETTQFLKDNHVKVIPIIQNEPKWDEFAETVGTPEKQDAIVDRLVTLVEDKGYEGIHIDFEAINAMDAALLTEFMKKLSTAFRQRGLTVSQAVVARVSEVPTVWGGAYKYSELAQYNDFMVVMAYDFTPAGWETPGPVAPLWWVDQVLSYVASQVPASQLFLGVPFYGYDWDLDADPPADSLSFRHVQELADLPSATGGFSPDDQSPWLRYIDDDGHQHEVWYENSTSLEKKLQLAIDHELAGFASWRLGAEDPDSWRVIGNLETPATPVLGGADTATSRYFAETGHWLNDKFLDYWLANGGLSQFGYPRTERFVEFDPIVGHSFEVQYFERARFEYHPEFANTEHEILLGHIGRWSLAQRQLDSWSTAVDPGSFDNSEAIYFPESGHTLRGAFREHWSNNGSLSQFGYPLSEEFTETNVEDGNTYIVQYFERARFELHTHSDTLESLVLLGLLGNEMLRDKRWIR